MIKLLLLLLLGCIVIAFVVAYYVILIMLAILGIILYLMAGVSMMVADAYGLPAGIFTFLGLGLLFFVLPALIDK